MPGLVYDGSTAGYVVAPGSYTVRLLVGADTLTRPLEVRDDPRDTARDGVLQRTIRRFS